MKKPFRFHRGEFDTGLYLRNLLKLPNIYAQEVIDEIVYHATFKWKLEDQLLGNEEAVRIEDIYNIGKIAGIFQLFCNGDINLGSIAFTRSHIVHGKQRSERGLMDMFYEVHKFVRTEHDNYPGDIADEASKDLRIGYVPAGTLPIGYVKYGTPLYREDGSIIEENILPEPPDDGSPYVPFYGEKFLVFEHLYKGISPLSVAIFKTLFECLMQIRYNGPSIKTFLGITLLVGEGYIYDVNIEPNGLYYTCRYRLDSVSNITNRTWRLFMWKNICRQKFKHFVLVQSV